jgi:hypothetical protein
VGNTRLFALLTAAVLLALPVSVGDAARIPPVKFTGSGRATWDRSPAADSGEPTPKATRGTATWHQYGSPNRVVTMKLVETSFANTPAKPNALQITAKVTRVRGRFPAACKRGVEVVIGLHDRSLPVYDPKTKRETVVSEMDLGSSECRLSYGYARGHAGNKVRIVTHRDANSAEPWHERFEWATSSPAYG